MTTRSSRPVGVSAIRFWVGTSSSIRVSVFEMDDNVLARRQQGGEVGADLERGADDRQVVREGVAERGSQGLRAALLALVEDDHANGLGIENVRGLHREVTRPALDERNISGDEVGEVLDLASAVGRARRQRPVAERDPRPVVVR